MFYCLWESKVSSHVMIVWEDKYHNSKCSDPFSLFTPQLYVLRMMPYNMEYCFGQLGSAASCVPSRPFVHSPLAHRPSTMRNRTGLTLFKHCSAVSKTHGYHSIFSTNQNIEPYKLLCRKLTLLSKTQYSYGEEIMHLKSYI